uniref:Uncharacterized protein n=1 Tax=Physcomitrium patens TaxID=3218 RepID=A0A2K1L1R9_PHYPA|nr:hypothetical protein PHYPA_002764 [Physcomitrium patens]
MTRGLQPQLPESAEQTKLHKGTRFVPHIKQKIITESRDFGEIGDNLSYSRVHLLLSRM